MAQAPSKPLFGKGPPALAVDILPEETRNGSARRTALVDWPAPIVDGSGVTYNSSGHLLIVGPASTIAAVRPRLPNALSHSFLPTVADTEAAAGTDRSQSEGPGLASKVGVTGHLGAFRVSACWNGRERDVAAVLGLASDETFDLVLDLQRQPAIIREEPPPGYFAPVSETDLAEALTLLPELVGELSKPRFFEHNASVCAHAWRGTIGCTACLDACPAEAIRSVEGLVETDPYLCRGCGSCATVCPTGATRYAQPRSTDLVERLQNLVAGYYHAGGRAPTLLLYTHDGPAGATVREQVSQFAESVLPLAVHDVGSVGIEAWLAALASGASQVLLLFAPSDPLSKREATASQIRVARTLLAALGHSAERTSMIFTDQEFGLVGNELPALVEQPVEILGGRDKRSILQRALQHLVAANDVPHTVTALPPGAPFGILDVNPDACTLCMSCVSACPRDALLGHNGGRLELHENRCVQCGLCAEICPEQAITLEPRFKIDALRETTPVVLNQAEMERCPGCGSPTYPGPMVATVLKKLAASGHDVGHDSTLRRRLLACEDCRSRGRV